MSNHYLEHKINSIRRVIFLIRMAYRASEVYQENSEVIERNVVRYVRSKPFQTMAISLFVGYLVGRRLRK